VSDQRRRDRDGLGWGENSHVKHRLVAHAADPQVSALAATSRGRLGALFDLTAGDGSGVELPQGDLFDPSVSAPTSKVICRLAKRTGATAFLCEWNDERRAKLTVKFPRAVLLKDHDSLPRLVAPGFFDWGLAISDPCGPSDHGEEVLADLSRRVRRLDTIITLNLSALERVAGVTGERDGDGQMLAQVAGLVASQERYRPMFDPEWWRRLLGRGHLLRSRVEICNRAFRGPVLVVTDYVANISPRLFETLA
jgi:hypothetical protein